MLIWQKECKGTVRMRNYGSSSYVLVKKENLQCIIGETFEIVESKREDCQELSIVYGWLAGLKAISLNKSSKGEKVIEFYFKDENVWRREPEVILTEWDELFDKFEKVLKEREKKKKA